jgi:predicted cupin superfamily sugar epimerase
MAELLDLAPHEEGGWYRQTWKSPVSFQPESYPGTRAAATVIYYVLGAGEVSIWHTVRSDELWLWHSGGPLTLTLGGNGERPDEQQSQELVLGPDLAAGQRPQALVPAGCWQTARPLADEDVLVSCVVAPGFDYADFVVLEPPH